jgi:hypothetical protein
VAGLWFLERCEAEEPMFSSKIVNISGPNDSRSSDAPADLSFALAGPSPKPRPSLSQSVGATFLCVHFFRASRYCVLRRGFDLAFPRVALSVELSIV